MKTTQKAETISKAQQLSELIEKRKELEKVEKEIKEFFKAIIGNEGVLLAGDYMILISERSRKDVDKKSLAAELGERYSQFEKESSYQIVEVKRA
jgi:bifunctional ADP-heptose synthase (sugar kinase/adenylyltransferase)